MKGTDSFVYSIKKFLYDLLWTFKVKRWLFVRQRKGGTLSNLTYSIGIVTYVDRYEIFFKPLIVELVTLFPDTEFIIAINGYHDQLVQVNYLTKISGFLAAFPNVRIVDFHAPQSLSRLWNLLILHSSFNKVLICNDDIRVSPSFRKDLEKSAAIDEEISLLNRSWSHFFISKSVVKKIGWFDQRFPGVGNEDEDYEARLVHAGICIQSFRINGLKNIAFITVNFSYGVDTEVVNTKYVKANKVYFDRKWKISNEPKEGYVYTEIMKAWLKPIEGMEAPDFYPDFKLYA